MENTVKINKNVSIVAYYFKNAGRRLKGFPKLMEYEGRRVIFTETGLRHLVRKGQKLVHIFDMTDGSADYRLEFDTESLDWRLIYMADMNYGEPVATT